MFGWFTAHGDIPIPKEHYTIVDDAGEWTVSKEYAEEGLEKGWLVVSLYYIDVFDNQFYQLQHV